MPGRPVPKLAPERRRSGRFAGLEKTHEDKSEGNRGRRGGGSTNLRPHGQLGMPKTPVRHLNLTQPTPVGAERQEEKVNAPEGGGGCGCDEYSLLLRPGPWPGRWRGGDGRSGGGEGDAGCPALYLP